MTRNFSPQVKTAIKAIMLFVFQYLTICSLLCDEKLITGNADRLSIRVKDADVRDLLLTLAEITGRNIILDPSVKGKVTLNLHDVTWKDAMQAILFLTDLGYLEYDNNDVIAPHKKLISSLDNLDTTRDDDTNSKSKSDNIISITCKMTFEEAKQCWPSVKKILTDDGKFQYDRKKLVAVISDRAGNIRNILDLLSVIKP